MRFTDAFRRCLAEREQPVAYGLFDFRHSDYFQMGESDLVDRARLAAIEPQYQQFEKVALLVEGQYSQKMAAVWCRHVMEMFDVRCFSDEASARQWLLTDARLSLIA